MATEEFSKGLDCKIIEKMVMEIPAGQASSQLKSKLYLQNGLSLGLSDKLQSFADDINLKI